MNEAVIRQHLERDLPDYEMVPESPQEAFESDQVNQADALAGSLSEWKRAAILKSKITRTPRSIAPLAELRERFK